MAEWFAQPDPKSGRDGTGLRFSCTMCGNCCSGPPGYVLVDEKEAAALAARFGMSPDEFIRTHTHATSEGRSLNERVVTLDDGREAHDCLFLDRRSIPGRAVCSVYEDRPAQCRTWPFWPSVVKSRETWERAKRVCPGMDQGTLVPLDQVRVRRDAVDI